MSGTLVEEIRAQWQGESPCDAFRTTRPLVAGIEQGCQDCGFTRREHLIRALLDAHQRLQDRCVELVVALNREGADNCACPTCTLLAQPWVQALLEAGDGTKRTGALI